MSEIYRDTTNIGLTFEIQAATVTKAEFIRNGTVVHTVNNSNIAAIPFVITKRSGSFQVKWTFTLENETHERLEEHVVVTPVFTVSELRAWDEDFVQTSNAKIVYLESLVRQIIQTYCNQKFEYTTQSVLFGLGANGVWYSPEKVLSLKDASYTLGDGGYSVHNLETYTSQGYNVKIPIEAEMYTLGLHPKPKKTVTVVGDFGWVSVPPEVKNAALYLAEAFSCNESLWRERYIKSVRAADWRFDYSEEAFHSTGSVIADGLLEPFKRIGYAAV